MCVHARVYMPEKLSANNFKVLRRRFQLSLCSSKTKLEGPQEAMQTCSTPCLGCPACQLHTYNIMLRLVVELLYSLLAEFHSSLPLFRLCQLHTYNIQLDKHTAGTNLMGKVCANLSTPRLVLV